MMISVTALSIVMAATIFLSAFTGIFYMTSPRTGDRNYFRNLAAFTMLLAAVSTSFELSALLKGIYWFTWATVVHSAATLGVTVLLFLTLRHLENVSGAPLRGRSILTNQKDIA